MKKFVPLLLPLIFGIVMIFVVNRCNNPPRPNRPYAVTHADPTAEPAPTEVPTVQPTPEATPVPAMMKVSLVSQNNANLGHWMVSCPNGCSSVGEFIHEDVNGTWFNDVNNKFVWIKIGGGTLIIEEQ